MTEKPTITNAAALWNEGRDSKEIADRLGIPESMVWRNMDRVRNRAAELRRAAA